MLSGLAGGKRRRNDGDEVPESQSFVARTVSSGLARVARGQSKDPPDLQAGSPSDAWSESPQATRSEVTTTTCSSTAYNSLRNELEARPTKWPPSIQRVRIQVYMLFEEPRSSAPAYWLSVFILLCIILSVVTFVLETMPELKHVSADLWLAIELVCTLVFTWEYALRILVCGVSGTSMWTFAKGTMNIIDLLSIVSFYAWLSMRSIGIARALGVLRMTRLVRIFRIFRLGKRAEGLKLIQIAVTKSLRALWVLCAFLGVAVILFSSLMYHVEKLGCPNLVALRSTMHDSNRTQFEIYDRECRNRLESQYGLCCNDHESPLDFPTIPAAIWWAVVTMVTVGYGDAVPRTTAGKVVGVATVLCGIVLIALPIAIIGQRFHEAYDDKALDSKRRHARENLERRITLQGAVSSPSSRPPTKKEAKKDPGLTLDQMGFCLRSMDLPAGELCQTAVKLAEELEGLASLQRKIGKLQAMEHERQEEVLERCERLFTYLNAHCKTQLERKKTMLRKIFPTVASKMEPTKSDKAGTAQVDSSSSQSQLPPATVSVPQVEREQQTAPIHQGSSEANDQEDRIVGTQGATAVGAGALDFEQDLTSGVEAAATPLATVSIRFSKEGKSGSLIAGLGLRAVACE